MKRSKFSRDMKRAEKIGKECALGSDLWKLMSEIEGHLMNGKHVLAYRLISKLLNSAEKADSVW